MQRFACYIGDATCIHADRCIGDVTCLLAVCYIGDETCRHVDSCNGDETCLLADCYIVDGTCITYVAVCK
jgi:hypothetical protein